MSTRRNNGRIRRQQRRDEALERDRVYASRSTGHKLAILDTRPGNASRERRRLEA